MDDFACLNRSMTYLNALKYLSLLDLLSFVIGQKACFVNLSYHALLPAESSCGTNGVGTLSDGATDSPTVIQNNVEKLDKPEVRVAVK